MRSLWPGSTGPAAFGAGPVLCASSRPAQELLERWWPGPPVALQLHSLRTLRGAGRHLDVGRAQGSGLPASRFIKGPGSCVLANLAMTWEGRGCKPSGIAA